MKKISKKFYDRLAFDGALEIETYCDICDKSIYDKEEIKDFFDNVNKYYKLCEERTKQRDIVVEKLLKLVEEIGEEKFDIDNFGNITYTGDKNKNN